MHSSDPTHRDDATRGESLTLLALGEPIDPDLDAHIHSCAECKAELDALRRTVTLAQHPGTDDDLAIATPSAAVWQNICAELRLETQTEVPDVAQHHGGRRSWRYWAGAAAAAVVIAVAAAGGGYLAGRNDQTSSTTTTASAALSQMPGGPTGVQGVATLQKIAAVQHVTVKAPNLPTRHGYYEVWLYNPDADIMVAIGT